MVRAAWVAMVVTATMVPSVAHATPALNVEDARSDIAWAAAETAFERTDGDVAVDIQHCTRLVPRKVRCGVKWWTTEEICTGPGRRILGTGVILQVTCRVNVTGEVPTFESEEML